jgi:hypothetical protein
MSKGKEVLRWIAMPFAALLTAIVVYAIGYFVTGMNMGVTEVYSGERVTSFTKVLTGCGLNFLTWGLFVLIAAAVAPRAKKVVMVVFSVLACLIVFSALVFFIIGEAQHTAVDYVYLLASLAGATVGPYYFRDVFDYKV